MHRADADPDLDPLIGRADDLAHVMEGLAAHRLVTIVGTGGMGKTRLAQAVLAEWRARDRDGWFVDLTTTTGLDLLGPGVVAALALEGSMDEDPIETIAAALADRDALVVLDNLEQLPAAKRTIDRLLAAVPTLRILATSRVPTGARGEEQVALGSLAIPDRDDPDTVEASAAGGLFLARARAIGHLRTLDPSTAADVARLIRRLDGLPLALELAAARTRVLNPGEILQRLDERGVAGVQASVDGTRRSLIAVLEWTLLLLTPAQSTLLSALSVCAGFDVATAEALVPDADVVDGLEALVMLGLVQRAEGVNGKSRFRLLETVRDEVARRSTEAERAVYLERHAGRMFEVAAEAKAALSGETPEAALASLTAEADNVRAALDHLDRADPKAGLGLWAHVGLLWDTYDRWPEGLRRYERTAALAPDASPELAKATLRYAAMIGDVRGMSSALALYDRALDAARSSGDIDAEINALSSIAMGAAATGDRVLAQRSLIELTELAATVDDPWQRLNIDEGLYSANSALFGAGSDAALAPLLEMHELATEAHLPSFRLATLGNLAWSYLDRGAYAVAAGHAAEATELARQLRHKFLPWALATWAVALAGEGDGARSVAVVNEAAALAEASGMPSDASIVIRAAIAAAVAAGRPLVAARAWGAAQGLHDRGDADLPPEDRRVAEAMLARARAGARAIDIELAIDDGRKDDPYALLRELPALLGAPKLAQQAPRRLQHGELTRREIEILAMVGEGKSDAEIAKALFISPKTASVHVSNVKAKLGLATRLEVALHAREIGLVRP